METFYTVKPPFFNMANFSYDLKKAFGSKFVCVHGNYEGEIELLFNEEIDTNELHTVAVAQVEGTYPHLLIKGLYNQKREDGIDKSDEISATIFGSYASGSLTLEQVDALELEAEPFIKLLEKGQFITLKARLDVHTPSLEAVEVFTDLKNWVDYYLIKLSQ